MAQRQFRTDDTSLWVDRYGSGSDGAVSPTTATDSTANTSISVTSGSTAATFGSGTGFANGNLILIHQSRNGGAGAGAWELNKISSGGGTTSVTLAYATVQAYDTTAQVYLLKQYTTVSITGGNTISASNWDGTKGGIVAYLAMTSITIGGTISANSAGYRGGNGVDGQTIGQQGEGTSGALGTQSVSANGNGGGGGGWSDNGPWDQGNGGGGGANAGTGGSNGIATGGGNNAHGGGGSLGSSAGNAGLTLMVFGGGGGSGGDKDGSGSTGAGGRGAGLILLIAPVITITGSISLTGGQGQGNVSYHCGAGGSGAGGSCLIKGQQVTLGSGLVTASGGTRVFRDGVGAGDEDGGSGGDGRIHVDYSQLLSGSTTPTIDSSVDTVLNDLPNEQNYTLLM